MLAGVYQPAWIEQLFQALGIEQVIDVYHALEYAGVVMTALGWSVEEQVVERRLWCNAEINIAAWLEEFAVVVRSANRTDEVMGALSYLEARAGRMAYKELKMRGLPVGSGQVEGMNKSVIGSRLKRSGMH